MKSKKYATYVKRKFCVDENDENDEVFQVDENFEKYQKVKDQSLHRKI